MRLNMIPTLVLYISILLVNNGLPNSQFETDNRVGMRGLPRPSTLSKLIGEFKNVSNR